MHAGVKDASVSCEVMPPWSTILSLPHSTELNFSQLTKTIYAVHTITAQYETIENLMITNSVQSLQEFDAKEMYLHFKNQ